MKQRIIGVMGPGKKATKQERELAFEVGKIIAELDCILLTGGVAHSVMHAASRGAKKAGGIVVGVLPHKLPSQTHPVSRYVDIPIITTFGEGRNLINSFSSDLLVAVGMCPGTASEVCFAIKAGKPVYLLGSQSVATEKFFQSVLRGEVYTMQQIEHLQKFLKKRLELLINKARK